MGQWSIVDFIDPADGPEDFPRVEIHSDNQLRQELDRLRKREPAIIGLQSENGDALQIGIGGSFAGIRHYVGGKVRCVLLADQRYSDKRVDFKSEEDSLAFWPDELIPAEQAVEIITHFFRSNSFPEWVNWKEWDQKAMKWQTRAVREAFQGMNGTPAQPVRSGPELVD